MYVCFLVKVPEHKMELSQVMLKRLLNPSLPQQFHYFFLFPNSNINFIMKNNNTLLPENLEINLENYEEVWPTYYSKISEIYQNKTHHHIKNCSVADELNQVCIFLWMFLC